MIKGYTVELEGNRSVSVGFGELKSGEKRFALKFTTPAPNGVVAEEVLTNHRTTKCRLEDGCLVTELTMTVEGFNQLMALGIKLGSELSDEGEI